MADSKISALSSATTPLAGTEVLPIVQSGSTVKVSVNNLTAGKTVNAGTVIVGTDPSGLGSLRVGGDTWIGGNVKLPDGTYDIGDSGATGRPRNGYFSNSVTIGTDPSGAGALRVASPGIWNGGYLRFAADGANDIGQTNNGRPNNIYLTGNLVIGTSGKGIDFSATSQAGGMTSELLADYEEGTFTPTVIGHTTAGTATYIRQQGYYTKVGNRVMFSIDLVYNSGTGTGDLGIAGLPYASSSDSMLKAVDVIGDGITLAASSYLQGAYIGISSTTMYLAQSTTGSATITTVAYDAAGQLVVSGQYFV